MFKDGLVRALCGFAFASMACGAQASLLNAQQTQIEIDRQSAGWIARDNWTNSLDAAGARRLLGAPALKPDGVTIEAPHWFSDVPTEVFDWRNQNGMNWVTPVLNQGNCGSCVAFATVATLETQSNVSSGLPWLNPRYSTQALFSCGGGGCDMGWMPSEAADYLVSSGVPDEACAPYTMGATGQDVACGSVCSDSAKRSTKIVSYATPSRGGNTAAVKAALRKGPLETTLNVYADFMSYGSGVYKHVTGSYLGGHAVSIIGFDDVQRAWIIRNSWGADWGMSGFGYVSYDDTSGVARETWQFEPAPAAGYSTIRNLRDRDYISGVYRFVTATTAVGSTGMKSSVVDGGGATVAELVCGGRECSMDFDSSKTPDGRYELRTASVGGTPIEAQPRYFYVSNAAPTIAVSFALSEGDQSKPLRGRVEFTVRSSSSPVPLSSLDFVVVQDGKEILRHRSDMVLPEMTTGWRTNLLPNGEYQIYFVGHVTTNLGDLAVESARATVRTQN